MQCLQRDRIRAEAAEVVTMSRDRPDLHSSAYINSRGVYKARSDISVCIDIDESGKVVMVVPLLVKRLVVVVEGEL